MNKLKNTKAREEIYNKLKEINVPISAENLYLLVRKEDDINISTVYRTLQAFENNNIVKKEISSIDSKAYYTLVSKKHYHLLECVKCHRQIRIDFCPFEDISSKIEKEYNFSIDENSIIYGICDECKKKNG